MERAHGKVECELCEETSGSAEAFCRQCARFICNESMNLHKRITIFKSHEVALLDDLKYGRAKHRGVFRGAGRGHSPLVLISPPPLPP